MKAISLTPTPPLGLNVHNLSGKNPAKTNIFGKNVDYVIMHTWCVFFLMSIPILNTLHFFTGLAYTTDCNSSSSLRLLRVSTTRGATNSPARCIAGRPVAYQVILEPGVGQFREFEPRRVHTRVNSLGLFLVHKLTCGKRESVS